MKEKKSTFPLIVLNLFFLCLLLYSNSGFSQIPYTVGNSMDENYEDSYPAPYGNYNNAARHQMLVLASEMLSSGMNAGPIYSVAFNVKELNGIPLENFEIKIGTTSQNDLTVWETGLTTVYTVSSYTDINGWNVHWFQAPFIWDGSSNIVVETCFENSFSSSNAVFYQTYTTNFTTLVCYEGSGGGGFLPPESSNSIFCSGTPTWFDQYDMRPNMQFYMSSNLSDDMGVVSWENPQTGINLGANESVTIKIKNNGTLAQNSYNLSYSIDGGISFVTETSNQLISPGDSANYSFSITADFSSYGTYNCIAVVDLTGDTAIFNDTLDNIIIKNFPLVSSFPYFEDFENGTGNWISGGINSSWEHGIPDGHDIDYAASGQNVWMTSLDDDYNENEKSWVESPCFNLSSLTNPVFEFKYWVETAEIEHGAAFQYSTDGINWTHLGQFIPTPVLPQNWYNSDEVLSLLFSGSSDGWTGSTGGWLTGTYSLLPLAGEPFVKLRVVFGSNQWWGWDGFAFDDMKIFQPPEMSYSSSTTTQNSDTTIQGALSQEIIGIQIVASSSTDPINVTKFYLSTSGTTNTADIDGAIMYYSGNSNIYSISDTFGIVSSPNGNFIIQGIQQLVEDTNFFWLAYNVNNNATNGNVLDASCDSLICDDTTRIPAVTDPPGTRTILEALSGTYYINADGTKDYLSFTEAVSDLIIHGVKGPVIFNVDDDSYNEQLVIPEILGSSSVNTITFQSTSLDSNAVQLTYAPTSSDNYVISLSGIENIIFQYLTIYSTGADYARVIEINGSSNISFNNNRLIGSMEALNGAGDDMAIVYSEGGSENSNITFQNNLFNYGSFGIDLVLYDYADGLQVFNNHFIDQYRCAVELEMNTAPSINGNYVYSVSDYNYFKGFALFDCPDDLSIQKNRLILNDVGGGTGINISYCHSDVNNKGLIANNFVSVIADNSSEGIIIDESSYKMLIHNSVNVVGNYSYSFAVRIYSYSTYIEMYNNIFANNAYGYSISLDPDYTVVVSDYNDLYSSGSTLAKYDDDIDDLNIWHTITGLDSNSVSCNPWYISDTNLHVFTIDLENKGVYVSEVTDDIDGDPRNTSNPDIGADEFTPPSTEIALTEILGPGNGCGLGLEGVSVILRNIGSNTINGGMTVSYSLIGNSTVISETVNRTIASGDTIVYHFSTPVDLSVMSSDSIFILQSYVDLAGDTYHENDSLKEYIYSGYIPPAPGLSDVTVSAGDSAILNASAYYPVLWFSDTLSGVPIGGGDYFVTPVMWDTTIFYANASNGVFDSLTTRFDGTSSGNGHMFNLRPQTDLVVSGFDVHLSGTMVFDLEIYYKVGSYYGYQQQPEAWTLISSQSVTGAGNNNPTHIDIDGLLLPAGETYGIYIYCSNSYSIRCNYGSPIYNDDYLSISGGASFQAYFGYNYSSRTWNGTVHYETTGVCTSNYSSATVYVTGTPIIHFSQTCLDLDTAVIGGYTTDTLLIYNSGTYPLIIDNVTTSTVAFQADTNYVYIYPGDTNELLVHFYPDAYGDFLDTLILNTNAGDTSVCLFGFGLFNPVLEIDPDSFNIMFTQCNDSITLPIEIKNSGPGTLEYSFVGQYGYSYDSISEIQFTTTGQNTTHTFHNLIKEADTIIVSVYIGGDYNGASEYATIFVDGTEVGVMNPTTYTDTEEFYFAGTEATSILADGIVTVVVDNSNGVNTGYYGDINRVELIINGIEWITLSSMSGSLLPGDSTNVEVEFNSNGLFSGTYNGNIILTSNDPLNPLLMIPSAMTIAVIPEMSFSSNCIEFYNIIANTTAEDTLFVYNTTCDTLEINNIYTATAEFVSDESDLVLLPYDSAQIIVSFSPPANGTYNDTIYFNGHGIDEKVCLLGVCGGLPIISVNPPDIDANIFSCDDSVTHPLNIYNTGIVDLNFNITGQTGINWISFTPDAGSVIPGDSVIIEVKFRTAGNQSGLYNATIHIQSNDPNNNDLAFPCSLTIDGEPEISLSYYLLHFGNVIQNNTKTLPLTIYNEGCDTLKISDLITSTAEFSVLTGSFVINPFDSTQINIDFTPSGLGTFSDTLSIYNNDDNVMIPLAGIGIGPPLISVSPDTFDITINDCNGIQTVPVIIGNSGQGDLSYQLSDTSNWISYTDTAGIVTGGSYKTLYIQFNSHGLSKGIYTSEIVISTNDPSNAILHLPVTMDARNNINLELNLGNDTTVCGGLILTPNSGFNDYIWQDGSTAMTYDVMSSGVYYVTAFIDACFKSDTINVIVNPVPVVSLTGLDSIYIITDPVDTLNGSPPGGTLTGAGLTGNIFDPSAAGSGIHNISYSYTNPEGCTDVAIKTIRVLPIFDLGGQLTYKNLSESELNNVKIYLRSSEGVIVDSVNTDASGDYLFNDIVYDEYQLLCYTPKPWGGANATDALGIQRHVVYLQPLNGLNLVVADVNNNGYVSSADALQVMRRFVGLINSFAAGDWAFDEDMINLYTNVTYNFNGLCFGDVDGSFIPSSVRKEMFVELLYEGHRKIVPGQSVSIPIKFVDENIVGSVSLVINYPEDIIHIRDLFINTDEAFFNISHGQIRIAWSDTESKSFKENDELVLISGFIDQSFNGEEINITLGYESEISDQYANPIEGINLKIPHLSQGNISSSFYLNQNFPNPCYDKTLIEYSLANDGWVDLSVYNLLGEKIKCIVSEDKASGKYNVLFDVSGLPAGQYLYKLKVNGKYSSFTNTKIMNVQH
jgi:hypothetical protein